MAGFNQQGAYWNDEADINLPIWPPAPQSTEQNFVNLDYYDFDQPMSVPPYYQANPLLPQQNAFDIPANPTLYSTYTHQSQPTQPALASSWAWNGYVDTVRPGEYINQHHPSSYDLSELDHGVRHEIPVVEEVDSEAFGLITYPSNIAGTSPATAGPAPIAPAPLTTRANLLSASSAPAPSAFTNFAEARQYRHRVRDTIEQAAVPDDVRANPARYVNILSAAMKDLSAANDDKRMLDDGSEVRPSPAFTRIRDVQYVEADLQSACWTILECMIDLHDNGCRLEASSQFPVMAPSKVYKDDKNLTFEERFEAIRGLLRSWKLCCMDAILDDQIKIMAIVRAPRGIDLQKTTYQYTNDERKKSKNSTDKALGRTPTSTPRRRKSTGAADSPTTRPRLTRVRATGLLASSLSTPPRFAGAGSTLAANPSTPSNPPLVRRTTRGNSKRSYKEPSDEDGDEDDDQSDWDITALAGKH